MWDFPSMPRVVAEVDARERELTDLQGERARRHELEAENAALRAELAGKSERLQVCEQAVAAAVGDAS